MIDIAVMILFLQQRSAMSESTFQKRIRQFGLENELFQLPIKPFTVMPLPDIVWRLRRSGWSMDEVLTWFLSV